MFGQRDGTVVLTQSRSDTESSSDCGRITASAVRPGATGATAIAGVDCSRDLAVGSDRIAFLQPTKAAPDLIVMGLDGSGRQRLDGNLDTDPGSFVTDGGSLSWIHHGCTGSREVSAPLTALPADRRETCPVRLRGARLTARGKLAVRVRRP